MATDYIVPPCGRSGPLYTHGFSCLSTNIRPFSADSRGQKGWGASSRRGREPGPSRADAATMDPTTTQQHRSPKGLRSLASPQKTSESYRPSGQRGSCRGTWRETRKAQQDRAPEGPTARFPPQLPEVRRAADASIYTHLFGRNYIDVRTKH